MPISTFMFRRGPACATPAVPQIAVKATTEKTIAVATPLVAFKVIGISPS